MQCREAQTHIDDYLDELLDSTEEVEALAAHFQQCDQCAEKLALARQFRQLLKNTPVPPPSAGFVDRALYNAVQQNAVQQNAVQQNALQQGAAERFNSPDHIHSHIHKHSHRKGFINGFGSALAAGLALWAVVSLFPQQQSTNTSIPTSSTTQTVAQTPTDSIISISLQEPTNITLAFHAAKAVQGATITISLSDNLELAGYQNRQTLEWKTDLLAGDNVLTLPVKALSAQQGKIVARISHSNLVKSIELKLNVQNDGSETKPMSENNLITTRAV
jgi:hypothetical protein